MALKPCRECKEMVSTEAKACPHCGVRDPTGAQQRARQLRALGFMGLIAVIVILAAVSSSGNHENSSGRRTPPATEMASIGSRAVATLGPVAACPEWKDYEQVVADSVRHDKVGWVQDFEGRGCTLIEQGDGGLVIDSGFFSIRVRLDKDGQAYWTGSMVGDPMQPLFVPASVASKPDDGQAQEHAVDAGHDTAALTAGQEVANQTADWYYKDDGEEGAECHALPAKTPQQFLDAAARRGATNLDITGNDTLKADAVVSYDLNGNNYEFSLYKSNGKCANPSGEPDNTKPDFSAISQTIIDERQKKLDDEALKHAADKGPWWMLDGTKTTMVCKSSKLAPMQDAKLAKVNGARNIQITGLEADSVPHKIDIVVEYELNGKSFFNVYYKNKDCNDSGPPSRAGKDKAPPRKASSEAGNAPH